MQYLGGKSRLSKEIAEVINNEIFRGQVKNGKRDSTINQSINQSIKECL